ncbi:bifunctional deaminase-reductase domain-containing protein [Arthrobacter sp. PAMC 25486]|nr:bifunctional deaminase-reductase domain-containing protein [Arthrobacter sp. PAMC 25486]
MNSLPKYVASNSLVEGSWYPTTILSGDVRARLTEHKSQPGGEIPVHGSATPAQSLFAGELIDELRLVIAPVVVGSGRRLFPDGCAPAGLRLISCRTPPGGLSLNNYQVTGSPAFSTYTGVSDVTSH